MKHLKILEDFVESKIHDRLDDDDLHIGDYVLLDTSAGTANHFGMDPFAKITGIIKKYLKSHNEILYKIRTIDLFSDEDVVQDGIGRASEFIRKLNKDEIDEFKTKISAIKYNI